MKGDVIYSTDSTTPTEKKVIKKKSKELNANSKSVTERKISGKKNVEDHQPISGRVDRASATEAVDSGSIPGRFKPKTIKIIIQSFPA